MSERQHWHPVASVEDLTQQPAAVRLLGEDLVLWRDGTGAVHAWPDRCPHRGARLSLGRVHEGRLECAYHGWQFASTGQCLQVPALPSFTPPATHRVGVHQACEAQGLVWVRLAPGPQSNLHPRAPAQVEYTYEVTAPYGAVLTKIPAAGSVAVADWRESIALFIQPVEPERSIVWLRLAMADFDSPHEKLRAFQDTIFLQDQPVLESQSPRLLPLDPRAELHTPADRASAAYRRYLSRLGITFGVCR